MNYFLDNLTTSTTSLLTTLGITSTPPVPTTSETMEPGNQFISGLQSKGLIQEILNKITFYQ